MTDELRKGFEKALPLLREYLPDLVFGDGYALMVYYCYVVKDRESEPLRTGDIDILVPEKVSVRGAKTLDQTLRDAGLSPVLKGRGILPAVSYEGSIEGVELEIEFLTDQVGPREDEVIKVQENLNAQALRFTRISLENSMEVEVDDVYFEGTREPVRIKVPTPAAFIFNKGLVFTRRNDLLKKAKDLYYIFDILASLDALREGIICDMAELKEKYPSWFKRFTANLSTCFEEPTSKGVGWVADQRPPNAFLELAHDQFRRYTYGVFRDFLERVQVDR
jgi:hypothetical protein